MDIENMLEKHRKEIEKEEKKDNNIIEKFIDMLKTSISSNNVKQELQEKYATILDKNEEIQYNVFSKVSDKDYTVLSFINDGEKCIKIPNILLPEETNSRTVFNYENGEFRINKEQTEQKNIEWETKQESEKILKEGRKYKVSWLANDFTEVVAEDTKETYKFDFMQDYIPLNLKNKLQEGDYIIAKDGKFEKDGGTIEESNKSENTYIGNIQQYIGEADKICMVMNIQDKVIKIKDMESQKEQFVKKEEIELEKGDLIKTKNSGYEKYDGAIDISNEELKQQIKNLYDNIF